MSRATEAIPAPGHEAFAIHPSLLSGLRGSSGSLAMLLAILSRLIFAEQLGCRAPPRLVLRNDLIRSPRRR
jgi:hypothetical protein